MGLPSKLLGTSECEVLHTRTHALALIGPAAVLIVLAAVIGAGLALVPSGARPVGQFGVGLLGLGLISWWVFVPYLRWRTTTYTLTDRRLILRRGVLTRTSLDLPLDRINDVASDRSLLDRVFGCGTLNVQTAAEAGVVVLRNVPDVKQVHAEITELLFGRGRMDRYDRRRSDLPDLGR